MKKKGKSSEEVFEEIVANTTSKGRRSIVNLKNICDEIEAKGLEICISLVGREAERRSISPTFLSIVNNERLKEYVNLRVQEQNVKEKPLFNGDSSELEDRVIELEKENNILRGLIKNFKMNIL